MASAFVKTQMATVHLEISPISELIKVWSPEVHIHGIPWKIEARKNEKVNFLAVSLQCAKEDDTSTWTVPARASFQLIPFSEEEKNTRVCHLTPFVFNSSYLSFGNPTFINWDDLLKAENKYVKDDTIELKIEITAEDPNYVNRSILKFESIDKSCDCGSLATYRLTVTNVMSLMAVRSPQFILRGLPWDLIVFKSQSSNLCIMLEAGKTPKKMSCKMTASVKLLSSKDNVVAIEKSNERTLQMLDNLKVMNIISWAEMLKPENGYFNDNSITLEVKITADKPKGDAPNADANVVAKRSRFECSICLEDIGSQDISATPCCHLYCTVCITAAIRNSRVCPLCKAAVQLKDLRRMYLSAEK